MRPPRTHALTRPVVLGVVDPGGQVFWWRLHPIGKSFAPVSIGGGPRVSS
jgi:hypothetical protein